MGVEAAGQGGPNGRRGARRLAVAGLLIVSLAVPRAAFAQAVIGEISRASVSSRAGEAEFASRGASVSSSGRFVAFTSEAGNLVADDLNEVTDIFVRDRLLGTTTRVSVSSSGAEGHGASYGASISGDGRRVAFASEADDLVPGDRNGWPDVFVHDRLTGDTVRASVGPGGADSDAEASEPCLSANGRRVVFHSFATNLVDGDGNSSCDVFLHDLRAGLTTRVSVAGDGSEGNHDSSFASISGNGRHVAFESEATNFAPGDVNGTQDVFVRDLLTGLTRLASVSTAGKHGNSSSSVPALSLDGRHVAFESHATNLVPGDGNGKEDIFVRDLVHKVTIRVSVATGGAEANGKSRSPAISAHGQRVVFQCAATNLVPGDDFVLWDTYVHDLSRGVTQCASFGLAGAQGDGAAFDPALSADGSVVAWESSATNLVPDDGNESSDIFVRELGP